MKKPLWLILWLLLLFAPCTYAATLSIQAADATLYDTWLPGNGNTLTLLVSVTGAPSEGELQFRFTEVSNWPGHCMNAPLNASTAGAKQDLCIYGQVHGVYTSTANALAGSPLSLPTDTLKNGHIAWETREDGRTPARFSWNSEASLPTDFTIVVIVTSEDYGAFGTLQAHLYQKDTVDETALLNIPKDNNNNEIADAWEVAAFGWKAGMTATTDDEPSGIADNSYTGDGFTTFEEYRGFQVNGVHKRLNLKRKDVFVHSEFDPTFYPQLLPEDRVRLGRATDATGEPQNGFPSVFKVWFIAQTEMDTTASSTSMNATRYPVGTVVPNINTGSSGREPSMSSATIGRYNRCRSFKEIQTHL